MMKNFKLKFSEYMQNISKSKSVGKFVLIVIQNTVLKINGLLLATNSLKMVRFTIE